MAVLMIGFVSASVFIVIRLSAIANPTVASLLATALPSPPDAPVMIATLLMIVLLPVIPAKTFRTVSRSCGDSFS